MQDGGFDFGSDEKAALTQLVQTLQQHRQLSQLAPYVQSYQQHAPAFSRWLQEQGRAQQQPAQQPAQPQSWKQQFWNPPEFNPSWATMLRKDEQGNLQVVPGAPPDILPKYQAYQQYQQDFAQKLLRNPIEALEPMVKNMIHEEAQQLVEQRLGQQNAQQSARQFVMDNAAWLYERDPQGNLMQQSIWNPTTAQMQTIPQLSQWGQKFQQYVQQEAMDQHRRGYSDDKRQQEVAMAMIQRDYAVAQLQARQQPGAAPAPAAAVPAAVPTNPREAANLEALRRANPPAAVPPTNGNATPGRKKIDRMNFKEALRQEMAANGINDQTLNNT